MLPNAVYTESTHGDRRIGVVRTAVALPAPSHLVLEAMIGQVQNLANQPEASPPPLNSLPSAQIDVRPIGFVKSDDVHDRSRRAPGRDAKIRLSPPSAFGS